MLQFAATQWSIGKRQADSYIARANAIILAEAAKDREQRIAESLAALVAVKKRAYAIDDLTNMRQAVAEISKLFGDYPAAKNEISGKLVVDNKPLLVREIVVEVPSESMDNPEWAAQAQDAPGPGEGVEQS
jgi:hypothetical protein